MGGEGKGAASCSQMEEDDKADVERKEGGRAGAPPTAGGVGQGVEEEEEGGGGEKVTGGEPPAAHSRGASAVICSHTARASLVCLSVSLWYLSCRVFCVHSLGLNTDATLGPQITHPLYTGPLAPDLHYEAINFPYIAWSRLC